MKKNNFKLAFSLIELSIVILIIGLLVLAISKGSRIIGQAKIRSAQQLTTSSPVNSIAGLRMWFEPSLAKSFDVAETTNGSAITNWYNINSQDNAPDPINLNQSTVGSKPTYIASGINNLPTLRFDGVSDYIAGTMGQMITSEKMTVFMVCSRRASVISTSSSIFYSTAASDDNQTAKTFIFALESGGNSLQTYRQGTPLSTKSPHPGNNISYILTVTFNGSNNINYYNGTQLSTGGSSGNFAIDRVAIGGRWYTGTFHDFYNGDISEMIVFDRALASAERKSVEQYLSQKYGIKLS